MRTQEPFRHLIWLQTAFIGDVVLTSGAIALAAENFPGIQQHLISTSAGCEVLKGSPFLSARISFAKRKSVFHAFRNVKHQLEDVGVDWDKALILQVHRSLRSSLLCKYLGIPTVTYDETVFGFLAKQRVRRDRSLHEAVRVASLLSALGLEQEKILGVKAHLQELPLLEANSWQKSFAEFEGKRVALAVGSQWGTKRWPIAYYKALAEKLLKAPNLGLILIGSAEEYALSDWIASDMQKIYPDKSIWNLAGQTSFDDLRRVFPKLDLIVSNDSSPIHFASAFDVPTLAIFGPTVPAFGFAPLSKEQRIIEHKNLSCRPCSDHGPQTCPLKHFRCMNELSVDLVFQAARELLKIP